MTPTRNIGVIEYLEMLTAGEAELPRNLAINRKFFFEETYRSLWFGLRRMRLQPHPSVPTWDLLDSNGKDTKFCYIDKVGIAHKLIMREETYGRIFFEYHPGLEEDNQPLEREWLFLLPIQAITYELQQVIYDSLKRLVST